MWTEVIGATDRSLVALVVLEADPAGCAVAGLSCSWSVSNTAFYTSSRRRLHRKVGLRWITYPGRALLVLASVSRGGCGSEGGHDGDGGEDAEAHGG